MTRCLLFLILGFALLPASAHAAETWSKAGTMHMARAGATAWLQADGRVMVAGGYNETLATVATTELYNPVTNQWSIGPRMTTVRGQAQAVQLADGRVLMAGGRYDLHHASNTAEVFDPVKGRWSSTGNMSKARAYFGATLLDDGRVLVVGGDGLFDSSPGAEIWDPATNAWTPTGPVIRDRTDLVITRLADGSVLVAGGYELGTLDGGATASAEIYHPDTNQWTAAAPMGEARYNLGLARLPDGRVLVAGGISGVGSQAAISRTSEIYDPATDTWSPAAAMTAPGAASGMTTLRDGRIAMTGGSRDQGIEFFDPGQGTWTPGPAMAEGHASHIAVRLADDSLLVAGGYGASKVAERLMRIPDPQPTVTATPTATPVATPPAAAPPADSKPLAVAKLSKLPWRVTVSKAGVVSFKLRCAGPGTCTDTAVLRLANGKSVARTKLKITQGRTATVRLKLSSATRRKFRKRTAVKLELTDRRASVWISLKT